MLELILRQVISMVKKAYPDYSVVTEADKINSNKDSFFIQTDYSLNSFATKYINKREITVTITHVPKGKSERRKMNNIIEKFDSIFGRFIELENKTLVVKSINSNIMQDAHGYYLVYSFQLPFLKEVINTYEVETGGANKPDKDKYEDMKEIIVDMGDFEINQKGMIR